jgi:hypothetical protein
MRRKRIEEKVTIKKSFGMKKKNPREKRTQCREYSSCTELVRRQRRERSMICAKRWWQRKWGKKGQFSSSSKEFDALLTQSWRSEVSFDKRESDPQIRFPI